MRRSRWTDKLPVSVAERERGIISYLQEAAAGGALTKEIHAAVSGRLGDAVTRTAYAATLERMAAAGTIELLRADREGGYVYRLPPAPDNGDAIMPDAAARSPGYQPADATETDSLRSLVDALHVNERSWHVLEARVGGERRTFAQIGGEIGGVTDGRAHHMQVRAAERIGKRLPSIAPALDALEAHAQALWSPFEGLVALDGAIRTCQAIFSDAGWERPREPELRRLLLAVRAAVAGGCATVEAQWPNLSLAVCALPPAIIAHPKVAEEVARRKREEQERRRRWTYAELAEGVHKEGNRPLHRREIAHRAEKLGRRSRFNGAACYSALASASGTFARVGPGTYGLAAWGLATVATYPEIIAAALKAARRPLAYQEIREAVRRNRAIKETSLRMNLSFHPRFYRSLEGSYGLRAWLLPPERRASPPPNWQVETATSLSRLQWAAARGWDIARSVERDRS